MISSTTSYGGLSAANILTLFGQASRSGSTSQNAAPSGSARSTASDASDPARAIRSILAQAQVQAQMTPGDDGSTIGATVVAAQVARTSIGSVTNATAMAAYAQTSGDTAVNSTSEWAVQMSEGDWSVSESITSSSTLSTSDQNDGTQAETTTTFQMSVSLDAVSVGIAFSVKGLGQLNVGSNGGVEFGHGNTSEVLQFGVGNNTSGVWAPNINIFGLDDSQAKQVGDAFTTAVSALGLGAIKQAGYFVDAYQGMLHQSAPVSP